MNLEKYHKTVRTIIELLESNSAWYETFEHEPVRTSKEAAQMRNGYTIDQGAKALIFRVKKAGGIVSFVQCVLPGSKRIDSKLLIKLLGSKNIRFANPEEIASVTDRIEIGGIPPFGNLFGITVYVEQTLLNQEKIIFNAGDRCFSVGMKSSDYLKIVKPIIETLI